MGVYGKKLFQKNRLEQFERKIDNYSYKLECELKEYEELQKKVEGI